MTAGGPPTVLEATTPVALSHRTSKPISQIKVGDKVKATDPVTGESVLQAVTALHINRDTDLTDVTVVTGHGARTVIKTTQHHLFWDGSQQRWVPASDLRAGDSLFTGTGRTATVQDVKNYAGARTLRDLTVGTIHTYYVLAGNTPVLVHNCDVTIYKAPAKGTTQKLVDEGFSADDFPGSGNGYPDGRAYFGHGEHGKAIAEDYATRGGYDGTVTQMRIPKHVFDEHFAEHVGSHNGVPNSEVGIPNTLFGILNRYDREVL